MARQLLGSLQATADLTDFTDHYQTALKQMLKARTAIDLGVKDDEQPKAGKVVDLMEALRRSLASAPGRQARRAATKSAGKRGARGARVLRHTTARPKRKAS